MTTLLPNRWLLLSPQLPATPSSLRVLVWRRLQQLGALNLQQGLWLLPQAPEHERLVSIFLAEIEQQGSTVWVFTAHLLDGTRQERLVARFHEERHKEYAEFISRCREFHHELEREAEARNWTFAELEENEHDLHKLTQWLREIQRRDFFPTAARQEAVDHLQHCREHLESFTQTVYTQQGVLSPSGEEAPSAETDTASPSLQGKPDVTGGKA